MNISPNRLKEIENIPDDNIDTSDIPELDDNFWNRAKMIKPITKKSISIRLDSDILDWFKSQGKGYQTLINRVLRSYVHHQQNQSKAKFTNKSYSDCIALAYSHILASTEFSGIVMGKSQVLVWVEVCKLPTIV